MILYNISFDSVNIVVNIDDSDDLFEYLVNSNDRNTRDLYIKDNKLYKKWSENYLVECKIQDLTNTKGIIHSISSYGNFIFK